MKRSTILIFLAVIVVLVLIATAWLSQRSSRIEKEHIQEAVATCISDGDHPNYPGLSQENYNALRAQSQEILDKVDSNVPTIRMHQAENQQWKWKLQLQHGFLFARYEISEPDKERLKIRYAPVKFGKELEIGSPNFTEVKWHPETKLLTVTDKKESVSIIGFLTEEGSSTPTLARLNNTVWRVNPPHQSTLIRYERENDDWQGKIIGVTKRNREFYLTSTHRWIEVEKVPGAQNQKTQTSSRNDIRTLLDIIMWVMIPICCSSTIAVLYHLRSTVDTFIRLSVETGEPEIENLSPNERREIFLIRWRRDGKIVSFAMHVAELSLAILIMALVLAKIFF
jgi:hypothetical protein